MSDSLLTKATWGKWNIIGIKRGELTRLEEDAYRSSVVDACGPNWKKDFEAGKWDIAPPPQLVSMEEEIRRFLGTFMKKSQITRMLGDVKRVVFYDLPPGTGRQVSAPDVGCIKAMMREKEVAGLVADTPQARLRLWHQCVNDFLAHRRAQEAATSGENRLNKIRAKAPSEGIFPTSGDVKERDVHQEQLTWLERLSVMLQAAPSEIFSGRDKTSKLLTQIKDTLDEATSHVK